MKQPDSEAGREVCVVSYSRHSTSTGSRMISPDRGETSERLFRRKDLFCVPEREGRTNPVLGSI
jgi:hypothetical protein